jgi:hypothetical protein
METHANTDTGAATTTRPRARSKRLSLADWIKRLREDNPEMKAADLRVSAAAEVHAHIRVDSAWQDIIARAVEDALKIYIVDPRAPRLPATTAQERDDLKATMRERLDDEIQTRAVLVLMDFVTETGKPLKKCTGADCKKLSTRSRDFYAEIAKRLTAGEHVEGNLTEPELQAIWRACRLGMRP